MATANESSLPERLAERDEEEWARFRSLLDYSAGFWLAFIFAPSSLDANVFRHRVTEALAAEGGGRMDVFLPQSPEELREALPWMLSKQHADAGCVWVQALQVDGAGRDEQPWAAAWEHVFLRTNGFRDVLRQRLKGGLVFVVPTNTKVMVREAAPDLWSVRTIVLELSGETIATRDALAVMANETRSIEEHRTTTTAPDAAFWMEEANRREPGSEGRAIALSQAALGWVAEGRLTEAMAAMSEAVDIYRKLAEQRPEAFMLGLASSLNNLGNMQSALGQDEAALASTQDAVDLFQKIAAQYPGVLLQDLARSLHNLGSRQRELGQHDEALMSMHGAVDLWREFTRLRPDTFLPDLAGSLNNLGAIQGELGQHEAGFASTQEAVDIRRKLAAQRPDASLPDLAKSLHNLSHGQRDLGQREAALASSQEVVDIYRKLAEQRPETFLPYLAKSLNNLGSMQSALGQREAALVSAKKSVDIYRKLAEQPLETFLPDFSASLFNLAIDYLEFERHEEALALAQEAFDIRWSLYERYPQTKDVQKAIAQLRAIHEILGTPIDEATQARMDRFASAQG